jgi:limonene-1,2-epoxide hydrolase
MSSNQQVVEAYFASTGTEYARVLAEDVELIEWADGGPASGVRTLGKAAFVENRGTREFQTQILRMTSAGSVVVVEGVARGAKKEGGSWTVRFCDIFEVEDGKVARLNAFGASVKEPE